MIPAPMVTTAVGRAQTIRMATADVGRRGTAAPTDARPVMFAQVPFLVDVFLFVLIYIHKGS